MASHTTTAVGPFCRDMYLRRVAACFFPWIHLCSMTYLQMFFVFVASVYLRVDLVSTLSDVFP